MIINKTNILFIDKQRHKKYNGEAILKLQLDNYDGRWGRGSNRDQVRLHKILNLFFSIIPSCTLICTMYINPV